MRRMRWTAAAALLGAIFARPVGAQPSLDLRHFRPPADPRAGFVQEPTRTVGPRAAAFSGFASYAIQPVVLEVDGRVVAAPVAEQLSFDALATLGVGRRVALVARAPVVGYQRGDDVTAEVPDAIPLPRTALGDVVGGAKVNLVEPSRLRPGFAAAGEVSLPTGDESSFVGEGAPTVTVLALFEQTLPGLTVRGRAGPRLRGEPDVYLGTELGHELDWAVGVAARPVDWGLARWRRWEVHGDLHGAVALTPELLGRYRSPAFASLAARFRVTDVSVLAGLEAPLDAALGVPRARGVVALRWAPRFYDTDGDGIPNDRDECPDLAEDRDGHADRDGCPDDDDDDDNVSDEQDRCREVAEDRDGFRDTDGCPDLDDDGDGVPDRADACPREPGAAADRGCPVRDADEDGIPDDRDWCPARAEDRDGFQDEDGCPDLDDDGVGIPDDEDACPLEPGTHGASPERYGCPTPDRDGDTFDDPVDACPDAPEDFDGTDDEDGCPDVEASPRGPLVWLEPVEPPAAVRWRQRPLWRTEATQVVVDPRSIPSLRAVAQQLNAHPSWTAVVTVRPTAPGALAGAQAASAAELFAARLRELCHRESAAVVGEPEAPAGPGVTAGEVLVTVFPGTEKEPPR